LRRYQAAILLVPAVAVLLLVFLRPVGMVLLFSFGGDHWSLATYREVLANETLWSLLRRTFILAGEVTLLCIVIGWPVTYTLLTAPPRFKRMIMLTLVLPAWTSVLVRSYAWLVLFGRNGPINKTLIYLGVITDPLPLLYNHAAVVIGMIHVMLPYFVFPLYGVLQRIDRQLVSAAGSLGAGPKLAFVSVILPLSLPGTLSGALLVFILSIGFFVTPALLGGLGDKTYVMEIANQIDQLVNWQVGSAMAVVLLATTLLLAAFCFRSLGSGAMQGDIQLAQNRKIGRLVSLCVGALSSFRSLCARRLEEVLGRQSFFAPRRRPAPDRFRILSPSSLVTFAVMLFIMAPIVIVFPLSFSGAPYLEFPPSTYSLRWYATYFSRQDWLLPTLTSFEIAFATMVLALLIGGAAALAIVRGRFPGRTLCLAVLTMPAITPTLIIAIGLYFQFSSWALVGTVSGFVLGHLVLALPLVVLILVGALRSVDFVPERAARSLGASPLRAFVLITLPVIKPSVLSAALFAFLASFDDVVIALFLSGVSVATLPKRMWDGIILDIEPTLTAVSSLLITLSVILMVVSQLAIRSTVQTVVGKDNDFD
jgi:putative spermidine/putrescine transport system permease protein